MGDSFKGSGGTQTTTLPPPLRPPMYGAANWLGNQMPSLWGQALPSYQGQLDQGLSPTQQQATRFMQSRAQQGGPEILGQAQGTLGALMDPGMSGLRNPYSMSSSSMGGGNTMTPEGLASSRAALLRYQNPTMAIGRPQQTPPNFFPGLPGGSGGGSGSTFRPGGGGSYPTQPMTPPGQSQGPSGGGPVTSMPGAAGGPTGVAPGWQSQASPSAPAGNGQPPQQVLQLLRMFGSSMQR